SCGTTGRDMTGIGVFRVTPGGHYVSPIGQEAALIARLGELRQLPRPVYGQLDSPPNLKLGYRHSHPWVQLSHAVEGVLEVRTDRGRFIAPPLRAVWVPAGITHQVVCAADT